MNDAQKIREVLDALKMTPAELANVLEYKTSVSIYNILGGKNKINGYVIHRFKKYLPSVNVEFLSNGIYPVLVGPTIESQKYVQLVEALVENQKLIAELLKELNPNK